MFRKAYLAKIENLNGFIYTILKEVLRSKSGRMLTEINEVRKQK